MKEIDRIVIKIAAGTARGRILIAANRGEPMYEAGDQTRALIDTASAFEAAGIRFAVIGGIAVGIRTEIPRATEDVDVTVPTSVARTTVTAALEAAGFEVTGSFEHSVNLRHPNGEPVQVAFDPAFDPMIERAEAVTLSDATIWVVTTDDLIAMKERAASDPKRRKSKALRDQADVELLRGDIPGDNEGW